MSRTGEIRERAEAASPPTDGSSWITERSPLGWDIFTGPLSNSSSDIAGSILHEADARFIAAARSDVPFLLEQLSKAEQLIEQIAEIIASPDQFHRRITGITRAACRVPGNGRQRMNGAEHLRWAKDRALVYVDAGDLPGAHASLISDLNSHPDTAGHAAGELGMMLMMGGHLSTPQEMREFIEGCN